MIVLSADMHGVINFSKIKNNEILGKLNEKDFFIVCGDFGVVWDGNEIDQRLQEWFDAQKFTTLFIDGNHENFTLLNLHQIVNWHGGKVHKISSKVIHLLRGQVFTIDDQKFFTFGGAFSIKRITGNSPVYTWEEEMPIESEFQEGLDNLRINNYEMDYILTHTCPLKWFNAIEQVPNPYEEPLNTYLDTIERKTSYKHWYFGHFHKNMTASHFTVIYNTIILLGGEKHESL